MDSAAHDVALLDVLSDRGRETLVDVLVTVEEILEAGWYPRKGSLPSGEREGVDNIHKQQNTIK